MLTERYLTPPEIARSRGVNVRKILAPIRSGELKAINYGTPARPQWKVSPEALAEFESRRTSIPAIQAPKVTRRSTRAPAKRIIQLI